MELINELIARAKANKQRIVLPEGTEERTLKAADRLLADEVADLILIGNPDEIKALANEYGLKHIKKACIVDPKNNEKKDTYATLMYELRKNKGVTLEKAYEFVEDPLFLGCLMIRTVMRTERWPAREIRRVMCCVRLFRLLRPLLA